MNGHTCQPAVDLAVRRLGERDRAALDRANNLIRRWDLNANQRRTSKPGEAAVFAQCSAQLLNALAGPGRLL